MEISVEIWILRLTDLDPIKIDLDWKGFPGSDSNTNFSCIKPDISVIYFGFKRSVDGKCDLVALTEGCKFIHADPCQYVIGYNRIVFFWVKFIVNNNIVFPHLGITNKPGTVRGDMYFMPAYILQLSSLRVVVPIYSLLDGNIKACARHQKGSSTGG